MDLATRALRIISDELQCLVVVGHHTNAGEARARGSEAEVVSLPGLLIWLLSPRTVRSLASFINQTYAARLALRAKKAFC